MRLYPSATICFGSIVSMISAIIQVFVGCAAQFAFSVQLQYMMERAKARVCINARAGLAPGNDPVRPPPDGRARRSHFIRYGHRSTRPDIDVRTAVDVECD